MSNRTLLLTLCLAALVGAAPAHAQGSVELGGFGTYTKFDTTLGLSSGGGGGARLSLISGSGWTTFVLEAEGAYASSKGGPPSIRYIPARARLLYAVPVGEMASVLIGGGGVRNDFNDGSASVSEWGYTGMIGFRLQLGSYMALRVDGIYDYIANPANEMPGVIDKNVNQGVHAGLQFPLWTDRRVRDRREEPRAVPVPETKPEPVREVVTEKPEPKPEKPATQLPDADRDGVEDVADSCPATPAGVMVDRAGCPVYRDSDNDGIVDGRDACPATPAGAEVDGTGCLVAKDTDRDGIADRSDRCPNTPAGDRVDATGCTVPVATPAPTPAPTPEPAPAKPVERTVTLRGVTFASGRDELTASSHAVLDELARQLIQASTIRLEIGGHTDAQGNHTANVRLSLARAEAVRAYLIMRGVPSERLVARGYGPDHPIASNATPSGRAMNRRVELRRIE